MRHAPHWFKGGWVTGQPGNEVPVDVGKLVAEEFVVDLPGLIDLGEGFGDEAYFLHQLNPFGGRQIIQFPRMALEHEDGPAGEKLIVVQIDLREPEVGDEMVGSGPAALAGFACRICHVSLAEHNRDQRIYRASP